LKIWILSDLHLPMSNLDWEIEFPEADICVVAGDVTDPPLESLAWLQENIGHRMPVVFVAGNHEYYGHSYLEALAEARLHASRFPAVHFLENDGTVIGGVRFLGATMWTDFDFYETPTRSMDAALLQMNDYRLVGYSREPRRRFSPEITRAIHQASRMWLDAALTERFDGPTVVVTHTCPHELSVDPAYAGNALNPAFVSDLSSVISQHQPDLWIHGHTHTCFDYTVPGTSTRIVCNPRGYVRFRGLEVENRQFERYKVVEVG
jgi:Icc-related predicted phosphoesterase